MKEFNDAEATCLKEVQGLPTKVQIGKDSGFVKGDKVVEV